MKFACVDYTVKEGQELPPNLMALEFKEHEGSFLVGALAALLTQDGQGGLRRRHGDPAHPASSRPATAPARRRPTRRSRCS